MFLYNKLVVVNTNKQKILATKKAQQFYAEPLLFILKNVSNF